MRDTRYTRYNEHPNYIPEAVAQVVAQGMAHHVLHDAVPGQGT